MKKLLLVLTLMLVPCMVYAMPGDDCKSTVIEQGKLDLKNVSYDLKYVADVVDMAGDRLEGRFGLQVPNLPDGYRVVITSDEGQTVLIKPTDAATLQGGVYKLEFMPYTCKTSIKTMEIRVPLYKLYCGINKNCDKDPWFDGTYENLASNQNATPQNKINKRLIIILVVLIVILAIAIAIVIKRRRDNEKDF